MHNIYAAGLNLENTYGEKEDAVDSFFSLCLSRCTEALPLYFVLVNLYKKVKKIKKLKKNI